MTDLSTQIPCDAARRTAAALLRANGGTTACLQMPPQAGDTSDAGQMGLDAPGFLSLPLSPVVFRKARVALEEDQLSRYELLVSADAVAAQVSEFQLSSAQCLFNMAAGLVIAGKLFRILAFTAAETQGQPYLYRLLLQEAAGDWPM